MTSIRSSTREVGPGADLKPIDADVNQDAGRKAARFYRICRVGALGVRHDFVVAPLATGLENRRALNAAELRLVEQEILKDFYSRNRQTSTNAYGFRSEREARLGYRECRTQRLRAECESMAIFFPATTCPR